MKTITPVKQVVSDVVRNMPTITELVTKDRITIHQDLRDMIMELIAAEKRKGPEPSKLYLEALDDTLSAIDTYFGA